MDVESNQVVRGALSVVASPEKHLDQPELFTSAWGAMLAARGKGFNPARLRPQHIFDSPTPAPEPTEVTCARAGQQVREIMVTKGIEKRRRYGG